MGSIGVNGVPTGSGLNMCYVTDNSDKLWHAGVWALLAAAVVGRSLHGIAKVKQMVYRFRDQYCLCRIDSASQSSFQPASSPSAWFSPQAIPNLSHSQGTCHLRN